MKILEPNVKGKEIEFIEKDQIYVVVWDHGLKAKLYNISVGPGQSTWYWVSMKEGPVLIDVNPAHYRYETFDEIINKTINNMYCTVYQFKTYKDMIRNWDNIKYIDKKTTIYKAEEGKD